MAVRIWELTAPEEVPPTLLPDLVQVYVTEPFSTYGEDDEDYRMLMQKPLDFLQSVGITAVNEDWTVVTELPKHHLFAGNFGGAMIALHFNSLTVSITVFKIVETI